MFNRQYQIRATRQAMRSRAARELYRPATKLKASGTRPLEDIFPSAYEEPEQFKLDFEGKRERDDKGLFCVDGAGF